MTTREHDDLHDVRVDAAWRSASREEPPRALDDAIRAAARREIGARPRSSEARAPDEVPQSLRPERWWWPLAAAATIGVVAVGLLQLVEPEHVVAPAADRAVHFATLATALEKIKKQEALEKTKKQEAPAVMAASAPVSEEAAKPDVPASPPASSAAPATPAKPAATLRKDAGAPFPREEGARTAATMPSAPPAERSAGAPASTPPPAAEPFPAEKLERESKEAAKSDAAAAAVAVPEPAPPAAVSEPPRQAQQTFASPSTQPATTIKQRALEAQGVTRATADRQVAPRAKVAPKLSVPDWIALIRKLRDEGSTGEAAKELAAFRNAYADPDTLLPPDLRDWKPKAP